MGRPRGGKFGYVMREFAHGKLHSGSKHGPIVHNVGQARAIAASEARRVARRRHHGRADGSMPHHHLG